MRKKIKNKRAARRRFANSAKKTKALNIKTIQARGGYRM